MFVKQRMFKPRILRKHLQLLLKLIIKDNNNIVKTGGVENLLKPYLDENTGNVEASFDNRMNDDAT